jgi:hypothetical protein
VPNGVYYIRVGGDSAMVTVGTFMLEWSRLPGATYFVPSMSSPARVMMGICAHTHMHHAASLVWLAHACVDRFPIAVPDNDNFMSPFSVSLLERSVSLPAQCTYGATNEVSEPIETAPNATLHTIWSVNCSAAPLQQHRSIVTPTY